ncbi:MAG: hypothetical protein NVV63_01960 [Opitutus sp.]|nr:hypothetical protein [Opitutus sp.]
MREHFGLPHFLPRERKLGFDQRSKQSLTPEVIAGFADQSQLCAPRVLQRRASTFIAVHKREAGNPVHVANARGPIERDVVAIIQHDDPVKGLARRIAHHLRQRSFTPM